MLLGLILMGNAAAGEIIVVRHPAKWISSRFRKIPAERNLELEEFVMNEALDFFIDYSNEIYSCIGQSNKLFLSYKKLYEEQFLHSQPSWAAMMRFLFTSVDVDILRKSINNNIADGENSDLVQRYFNTKPSGLLQLTDVESLISKMISGELKSRLSPKVLNFFIVTIIEAINIVVALQVTFLLFVKRFFKDIV